MQERFRTFARTLYGALCYYSGASSVQRWRARGGDRLRILGYHRIDGRSFEAHLRFLTRHYRIVTLHEAHRMLARESPLQPEALALTFDDAHRSFYTQVYPLLRRFGVPATLFVATDYVGTGKFYWFDLVDAILDRTTESEIRIGDEVYPITRDDRAGSKELVKNRLKAMPEARKSAALEALVARSGFPGVQPVEEARVIEWTDAAEMLASGLVDIGAHSCSHSILTRVPLAVARREIGESRRILQQRLGVPVDFFAYPNGGPQDFNREVMRCVQQAGYLAAVTLVEGVCRPDDDPFAWRRISVSGGFTRQALAAKVAGLWPTRSR